MADDLVTQLKTNAQAMAANTAPPAIGSDPLHYLNGQAAAEIERLRAALLGTIMVIDALAAKAPAEMQNGFKMWRGEIERAITNEQPMTKK